MDGFHPNMSFGSWLRQLMGEADIEGEAAGSGVLPESKSALLWCWECWFQHWFQPLEYILLKVKVLVAQSCPTLYYPMDCSLPGSSAHGILQARILEWVASPGDLLDPGIKPGFPELEADCLPSEPPEGP